MAAVVEPSLLQFAGGLAATGDGTGPGDPKGLFGGLVWVWSASAPKIGPFPAAQHGFDGVQQRVEHGDFVGFRVDGDLRRDDPGAGVQRGQQVNLPAVGAAGTS
ncbi:hypothetical protein [Actinoplanes sp. ATCC 53533]|uniref:hypothetical protein n=1 Tax=Actinoplanes sp. ATCC 53533 TaxID=1288362 RepID=UPI001315941B|nr:hypothetical protein [Actinoplanes sp. ATCC 53533]